MVPDPRTAPPRPDLSWLRRRRLPDATAPPDAAPRATAGGNPALRDFLTAGSTGHRRQEHAPAAAAPPPPASRREAAPAGSASLDLDAPAPSAGVNFHRPAPPSGARPIRTPTDTSLDLDAPASRPTPALGAGTAPIPAAAPSRRPDTSSEVARRRRDPRVAPTGRRLLTPSEPTVTLTRLQSGIGTVSIQLAIGGTAGELRLGCVYELADGISSTVQPEQGERAAPAGSRRPVLLARHDRFEQLDLDARQIRRLRRAVLTARSADARPPAWTGTILLTTYGGARLEVPLDSLQGGDVAVLFSLYQVRGELVVRAEMQALIGGIREAARAYGFERITWLDANTPLR